MVAAMAPALAPDLSYAIRLEAIDRARNVARHYAIDASLDLFGAIVVTASWGRIGARGQSRSASFDSPAAAEHHVQQLLRRRASAKRRIGVAYLYCSGEPPEQDTPALEEHAATALTR